jgi:hypothetical protein
MSSAGILFLLIVLASFSGAKSSSAGNEPPSPKNLPSQQEVIDNLSKSTNFLSETDFGKTQPAASHLDDISHVLEFFRHWGTKSDQNPQPIVFPDMYLYGLTVDGWQLTQIADAVRANSEAQTTRWNDLLGNVLDDLFAKASFVDELIGENGGSGGWGGSGGTCAKGPLKQSVDTKRLATEINQGVLVTAITRDKDGKEVPTYEVWFCLKALINYQDRYDHFDRLSSPTERVLTPGNYAFWTQKGSNHGAMVFISDVGIGDRQIDLPIP